MHAWAEVCHLSQSSKSVLTGFFSRCTQYWLKNHWPTRLSSNTPCTTVFLIQQSCKIITFRCLVICVHAYTWRKKLKWSCKGSHSSSVSSSNCLVRLQTSIKKAMGWCTALWKMLLFCAKSIVKESHKFELGRQRRRRRKKEKHFGRLATFWLGTFAMLLVPLSVLFIKSQSFTEKKSVELPMVGYFNPLTSLNNEYQ